MTVAPHAKDIARHFLPSRWHYHYTQAKLRSDPLYDGVCAALADQRAPLLDLGCGIGLLAHCLRLQRHHLPYLGVDSDADKIALAERAARSAGLADCEFKTVDLAREFPAHQGTVLLLDVLHYLYPAAQTQLLRCCARALSADGVLIMRTGIDDGGWRARLTHLADWVGRGVRWMNTHPKHYPTRAELEQQFAELQLSAQFTPLHERTPFNNWMVVARRQR